MNIPAPRARFGFAAGIFLGLGAWLPQAVLGGPLDEPPGRLELLALVNVAAVGLVLPVAGGKWRRAALGVTAAATFWLGFHATFCAVRRQSVDARIERAVRHHPTSQDYWSKRLTDIVKNADPHLRAVVRARIEQDIADIEREHERWLNEARWEEGAWRNGFIVSAGGALLCAAALVLHVLRFRDGKELSSEAS